MESLEHGPEQLSADQALEELEEESNPTDTDESELTGSAEPGTTATPEGTAEVGK